jgi:peptide/nickel transport system substrate-binding protein
MAWPGTPKTLDPPLALAGEEYFITGNVYDNLTRVDEKLQPQPQLATQWVPDDQGKVWTFTLRQGVKFHHGPEFTSKDVVFTFERLLDPKTASPGRRAMGPIEKVEPAGSHSVRFHLASPYADLPLALGERFGRIVPADRGDLLRSEPSGTGPFRLVDFRPGERVRMARFKDYWLQGRPYLDEVWQVSLPQAAAQVAALAGGDVQAVLEAPVAYIRTLEQAAGVAIVEVKSPAFQPVTMLSDQKPFDDGRVRLAMKHLVDREAVIRAVWQGHATATDDHPVPPVNPFYAPVSPKHTYDVARAKALLAEAGHPGGFGVELWTSNERIGLTELAVAIQQMVAPAGIKVEIKSVPWSVHGATVWKTKSFYLNHWVGRATIDESLYPFFHSSGAWNEGNFSNAKLDRLLDEGRSQTDVRKRKDAYAQAQQSIHDDGHMVVAYHSNYVTAMRANIRGLVVHPLRYWDFRETYLEA